MAWSDIDLESGVLTVRRILQRVSDDLAFGEPKTERSRRTLYLPQSCVLALKQHATTTEQRRTPGTQNPHPKQPADLVLISRTGRALEPRSINRMMDVLLRQADLDHMPVHDLRHTCATLLLNDGTTNREVMEQLGHSSIHVTMNIYAHVLDDSKRELTNRMDQLLDDDG